jgi:hypothetical protein
MHDQQPERASMTDPDLKEHADEVANDDAGNAVTRWFGSQFYQLHPLLQALHRDGGCLQGRIAIRTGLGLGGWIGQRLAQRLGIPCGIAESEFEVRISHRDGVLHWDRRFGRDHDMKSTFRPVGRWPDGYWIEDTGPVSLQLTVDIVEGGWHWRCLRIHFGGVRLPLWLFPRSTAYKTVDGNNYRFHVGFALPLVGTVLSYEGALRLERPSGE